MAYLPLLFIQIAFFFSGKARFAKGQCNCIKHILQSEFTPLLPSAPPQAVLFHSYQSLHVALSSSSTPQNNSVNPVHFKLIKTIWCMLHRFMAAHLVNSTALMPQAKYPHFQGKSLPVLCPILSVPDTATDVKTFMNQTCTWPKSFDCNLKLSPWIIWIFKLQQQHSRSIYYISTFPCNTKYLCIVFY